MRTPALPPVWLAVASITAVQVGAAVSVPVFDTLGVAGTTWARLTVAALALLLVTRPGRVTGAQFRSAALLGVAMAGSSMLFAAATDRIPLGTAVAVEFCGPLGVAAMTARRWSTRLVWPAAALAGVVLLTEPWSLGDAAGGAGRWLGVLCAAGAALCWGAYIVLTAKVGQAMTGLRGLAVALPVAAVVTLPVGIGPLVAGLGEPGGRTGLAWCALAGLLVPLASYALEMVALRRMPTAVFGVWMALEPAMAALVGWTLLGQGVPLSHLPGVALVVLAGILTQRSTDHPASDPAGILPEWPTTPTSPSASGSASPVPSRASD